MKKYVIPQNRKVQARNLLAFKGETQKVQYDFSPWEAENGTITSVDWTLKSGQASITSEALTSSKATATITTSEHGRSTIEIKATSNTGLIMVTTLKVTAKDLTTNSDYGYTH